jgi:hypothetical protein
MAKVPAPFSTPAAPGRSMIAPQRPRPGARRLGGNAAAGPCPGRRGPGHWQPEALGLRRAGPAGPAGRPARPGPGASAFKYNLKGRLCASPQLENAPAADPPAPGPGSGHMWLGHAAIARQRSLRRLRGGAAGDPGPARLESTGNQPSGLLPRRRVTVEPPMAPGSCLIASARAGTTATQPELLSIARAKLHTARAACIGCRTPPSLTAAAASVNPDRHGIEVCLSACHGESRIGSAASSFVPGSRGGLPVSALKAPCFRSSAQGV